jgi:hypothetical protein
VQKALTAPVKRGRRKSATTATTRKKPVSRGRRKKS